jgi:hypothetical protein
MYSQKGDVVLDPFMGLGTTTIAAIINERNSVGYEIDPLLKPLLKDILSSTDISLANTLLYNRYKKHLDFIEERLKQKKEVKYDNVKLNCKVMTGQETDLEFHYLKDINLQRENDELSFEATYFLDRKIEELPPTEQGSLFYNE